jgi:hypothetical protein
MCGGCQYDDVIEIREDHTLATEGLVGGYKGRLQSQRKEEGAEGIALQDPFSHSKSEPLMSGVHHERGHDEGFEESSCQGGLVHW